MLMGSRSRYNGSHALTRIARHEHRWFNLVPGLLLGILCAVADAVVTPDLVCLAQSNETSARRNGYLTVSPCCNKQLVMSTSWHDDLD
jgi:hypothetical protein